MRAWLGLAHDSEERLCYKDLGPTGRHFVGCFGTSEYNTKHMGDQDSAKDARFSPLTEHKMLVYYNVILYRRYDT